MKISIWILLMACPLLAGGQTQKSFKRSFPPVPSLSKSQYAVFIQDKYQIITTRLHEGLELDESCFQKGKPDCEAYRAINKRKPAKAFQHESMTHLAALHCEGQGGTHFIAFDAQKKEYNFCRFRDHSMVNSWSLYFKTHPIPVVK